tara:strand:- start:312 stop:641 length:330 start_codon:yes stop_codon:yes gene_type:complete
MAITYSWDFSALDAYPTSEGQADVVYNIHWTLNGDDGEGHTGSVYGTVKCTYTEGDPFVPFASLTKSEVEGWTTTNLGSETVSELEGNIATQISEQVTPTTEALPPPWS